MTTTHPGRPTADVPDTRDMITVHRFLRREFRLAPGLVERVAPGDVRRAAVVGQHLDFMSEFLHYHHSAEDEVLWPVLVERVPDELAPPVELMEAQHERVDELLADLYVGLHEHMEAEETRILPLAASCLSVAEWKRVGEASTADHAKKQLPLIVPPLSKRAFRRYCLALHGTAAP